MDFSKAQLESQGFADIGVSKNTGKFNVGSGINFNPESLAARVGASFNDKGFNSALNYTQGERGFSEVNVNAGYGNDFIQGEVDYSKTNNGDSLLGNLNIGDDKLRLLLSYLKDSEGTNLKGGIQSTTALKEGLLNSALELDTNFEDPKISGRVNYTNPTGRLNLNAGASYSEGEKANFNAGLNYSFALGTDKNGIMKSKMNPRKKYANGSSAKGMNVNNYIISPAEALADYDIMMAKVEAKAMSNPWLPIVAAVGGAAQSFVGNANMYKKPGETIPGIATGGNINAVNDRGVVTAMGTNNVQQDVEVEDGERYITPQGQTGEFEGATHEENGIPLKVTQDPNANPEQGQVPEGTQVFSDRLKVGDKTIAERQATRERQTAKLEKMASEPLVDKAIKNSLQRKMQAIEKEKMADLAFQEKVNNIQQMADTMVAAYGTSMSGIQDNPIGESMRYAGGTGITGIDPTTKKAFDAWFESTILDGSFGKKYPKLSGKLAIDKAIENPNLRKDFQTTLFKEKAGTKDADNNYTIDGDFGKTTNAAAKTYADIYDTYRNQELPAYDKMYPGYKYIDLPKLRAGTYEAPDVKGAGGIEMDFAPTTDNPTFDWKTMPEIPELIISGKQGAESGGLTAKEAEAAEDAAFYTPGQVGTPIVPKENPPGTMFSRGLEKIAGGGGGGLPGIGDAVKLFGNYLGMTSGIKTANEQRATDIPFQNVYKNAGEEAQRMLDNAKQGIETGKAQAIVKANTNARSSKKGARNSARGVNQMRAMDWLYDSALNQQTADIMAKASEQMAGIDVQKSGVSMNADQLKGQGEWQRVVADAAAKDAYYTALGLGRKDFATGVQQSGKDLNDMKQNKVIEGLMKNYGKWFKGNADGSLANKDETSTDTKTSKNKDKEIELTDSKGKKFKITQSQFDKLMNT
jgi:hypothetical protein